MVFLAAEQRLTVPQIATIVRESEATVLRWRTRDRAEGFDGLHDAPRAGRPCEVTETYRAALGTTGRRRPPSWGLPCLCGTLPRLVDDVAERTGIQRLG
jgi:transposase